MSSWMVVLLLALLNVEMFECGCYKNWSRCTPQTKFLTGIAWKHCPDFCRKCRGQPTGKCVRVYNKVCSGGYNCACFGKVGKKSTRPIDVATCKFRL